MSPLSRRKALLLLVAASTAACSRRRQGQPSVGIATAGATSQVFQPPLYPNETPELRALINKYAALYELPAELVHRLAIRESTHRPWARNGPYYGLLQILPETVPWAIAAPHPSFWMPKPTLNMR